MNKNNWKIVFRCGLFLSLAFVAAAFFSLGEGNHADAWRWFWTSVVAGVFTTGCSGGRVP
jgi:hypothetical protein